MFSSWPLETSPQSLPIAPGLASGCHDQNWTHRRLTLGSQKCRDMRSLLCYGPVRLAGANMRFQNKGGYVFVPDRPIVVIGSVPSCKYSSPQLDIQGDPDTISGQSGSAGEQPDRTKGRVVFSIWNCGPFAFSVPFVLKTHLNVGDPVAQLRFSRMNL